MANRPHLKDLNRATLDDLANIPLMNDTRAIMVLNYRNREGPFKSTNDLVKVPGINKVLRDRIAEYCEVKEPEATVNAGGINAGAGGGFNVTPPQVKDGKRSGGKPKGSAKRKGSGADAKPVKADTKSESESES